MWATTARAARATLAVGSRQLGRREAEQRPRDVLPVARVRQRVSPSRNRSAAAATRPRMRPTAPSLKRERATFAASPPRAEERQALLEQRPRTLVVADRQAEIAEVVDRKRGDPPVADLTGTGDGLLERRSGPVVAGSSS
jgi:hypothetical protein